MHAQSILHAKMTRTSSNAINRDGLEAQRSKSFVWYRPVQVATGVHDHTVASFFTPLLPPPRASLLTMVKCPECSSEDIDTTDGVTMCLDCGHELTEADLNPPSAFKVGLVLEAGKVPGKDKLSKLSVDVGCGEPITVVTAAGNIAVGNKIVIATVGAVINDEVVKKGKVRPNFGDDRAPAQTMLELAPLVSTVELLELAAMFAGRGLHE